jgi:CheY-like chemotaxis protein
MEPIKILLVEDNEGDILLTTEALSESRILNVVHIVRDGKQAMDYLEKTGPYSTVLTPDLILLDINLPRKNGHEVLHYIKFHEAHKHIPVIMLTTSSSPNDIVSCYRGYANCYITKPVDVNAFMNVITTIEDFWLSTVQLPKIS